MKKIFPIVIFILCASCLGCRQGNAPVPATAQANASPLTLDVFGNEAIPDSLTGASCYFAENSNDFKAGKYLLFMAGAGDRVLFYVNHQAVLLKLAPKETLSGQDQTDWEKYNILPYTNGNYILKLKWATGKTTGEESAEASGNFTLYTKDGRTLQKKLVGGCGS